MTAKLWKLECDPDCGFLVRSHDKGEIIKIGKDHATNAHKMNVSDKETENMITTA